MHLDQAVVSLLTCETCGDTVAQETRIGTATANLGPKVKASPHPIFVSTMWKSLALHVLGLNWSGEKVSLVLEDWELARAALSCHVALDLLEMDEAW